MMNRWITASLLAVVCHAGWAAQGLPTIKDGLWEVTLQEQKESAALPVKVLQCVDRKTSALMLLAPLPGQEACRAPLVKKSGDGYNVQTVCSVHDLKVHTRIHLTGDFTAHYAGAFETRYASSQVPQPKPQKFEGRWLGECKLGMKPGDLVLPNRVTINLPEKVSSAKDNKHDHDHSAPGHKH